MAEDSTNRLLWHEGEAEGESEDDEISREWPAYRRAYAALCRAQADSKDGVLGSNWQVLANSCSTTSLGTYKTGMRRLRQTHMARPEWGPYKVVGQVVCDAIREGKGSSSVKTILNAAAMAYTMGVVSEPVPKRLWKAFKAAQRLEEKSTQEWGSFEAMQIMAHQADSELEWCVVGLAVLSTLLGLRVGKAASISFHRLGFWQERRSSMTAKSTGLGFPVRFREWPSNGCSFAPGLHNDAGTSTSSTDWSLRTNCKMSWRPFCVDPSGRTSGGTRGDAWAQRPCTRLEARSLASRRGSGGGAQERQWPTSTARTQDASGTHSQRLPPPPNYLKGRPWIAGTATRRCTEFSAPEAYDIPEGNAPDSPSPRKTDGRSGKRGKRRHSA